MKVKKRTLLLIACLVWGIAGFNILRIGILAYRPYISVLNVILSLLVFAIFQTFIFGRLVKKHTQRILDYASPDLDRNILSPSFIRDWAPLFCWQAFYLEKIIV